AKNHDDHPLSPAGRLRLVQLHHFPGHDRTNKRIASCRSLLRLFRAYYFWGFARERLGAWRDIASYKQGGRARLSQA
ncbi:hypothetical protein, partial [Pseudomonas putida]